MAPPRSLIPRRRALENHEDADDKVNRCALSSKKSLSTLLESRLSLERNIRLIEEKRSNLKLSIKNINILFLSYKDKIVSATEEKKKLEKKLKKQKKIILNLQTRSDHFLLIWQRAKDEIAALGFREKELLNELQTIREKTPRLQASPCEEISRLEKQVLSTLEKVGITVDLEEAPEAAPHKDESSDNPPTPPVWSASPYSRAPPQTAHMSQNLLAVRNEVEAESPVPHGTSPSPRAATPAAPRPVEPRQALEPFFFDQNLRISERRGLGMRLRAIVRDRGFLRCAFPISMPQNYLLCADILMGTGDQRSILRTVANGLVCRSICASLPVSVAYFFDPKMNPARASSCVYARVHGAVTHPRNRAAFSKATRLAQAHISKLMRKLPGPPPHSAPRVASGGASHDILHALISAGTALSLQLEIIMQSLLYDAFRAAPEPRRAAQRDPGKGARAPLLYAQDVHREAIRTRLFSFFQAFETFSETATADARVNKRIDVFGFVFLSRVFLEGFLGFARAMDEGKRSMKIVGRFRFFIYILIKTLSARCSTHIGDAAPVHAHMTAAQIKEKCAEIFSVQPGAAIDATLRYLACDTLFLLLSLQISLFQDRCPKISVGSPRFADFTRSYEKDTFLGFMAAVWGAHVVSVARSDIERHELISVRDYLLILTRCIAPHSFEIVEKLDSAQKMSLVIDLLAEAPSVSVAKRPLRFHAEAEAACAAEGAALSASNGLGRMGVTRMHIKKIVAPLVGCEAIFDFVRAVFDLNDSLHRLRAFDCAAAATLSATAPTDLDESPYCALTRTVLALCSARKQDVPATLHPSDESPRAVALLAGSAPQLRAVLRVWACL
eukprot:gnl/Chilomastix_cuspidata/1493.p1 GENE.gnl/Chilomastix_cuspidata/1493~~gnl/Chilomastix_cuspidata/1493.p1  ORF type:complete len:842 (-),score=266.07 gnl/Chilomastix_cuspidata/1493:949-3474(-)